MNHAEEPDVIRTRMLEVVRTLQRIPEGPDREDLDTYRHQLAALGRTIRQPPTPTVVPRTPEPARAVEPQRPDQSIEL
jgi:hypothetical protein